MIPKRSDAGHLLDLVLPLDTMLVIGRLTSTSCSTTDLVLVLPTLTGWRMTGTSTGTGWQGDALTSRR